MDDKQLLIWYLKGFNDELGGIYDLPSNLAAAVAYDLGAIHAFMGDNAKSIDNLNNEEILTEINAEYERTICNS